MFYSAQILKTHWGVQDNSFKKRLQYALKQNKLIKIRKGLYADASQILDATEEDRKHAGGLIYTPSYLSYETVLLGAGVLFQRTPVMIYAGPYSKEITIDAYAQSFQRKRLPGALLTNMTGLIQTKTYTLATPERAVCDCLYHNLTYPFDSLESINRELIITIATVYSHYKPLLLERVLVLHHLHGNTTRYA